LVLERGRKNKPREMGYPREGSPHPSYQTFSAKEEIAHQPDDPFSWQDAGF
jgi:hypothetical protein